LQLKSIHNSSRVNTFRLFAYFLAENFPGKVAEIFLPSYGFVRQWIILAVAPSCLGVHDLPF